MYRDKNEICSVQVLRRIENGGVKRVKIEVFRRLMMKMGVLPERFYASVMVTECSGFRLKTLIHTHVIRKAYQEAEMELQGLESVLVPGYPRNEQYLMAIKALLDWKKGKITAGEYLETLLKSLRYTVPDLDDIDIAGWPFNRNEFDILIEVANAYHSMNEQEKWLEFLLKLKANVERNYMDWDHYVVWHAVILADLSQLMCMTGRYDKAAEYCDTGILECRQQRILGDVPYFLFDQAWIRENQLRMGIYPKTESPEQQDDAVKKERAFCRKQLVQGYYLSVAQGDIHGAMRTKKYTNTFIRMGLSCFSSIGGSRVINCLIIIWIWGRCRISVRHENSLTRNFCVHNCCGCCKDEKRCACNLCEGCMCRIGKYYEINLQDSDRKR